MSDFNFFCYELGMYFSSLIHVQIHYIDWKGGRGSLKKYGQVIKPHKKGAQLSTILLY